MPHESDEFPEAKVIGQPYSQNAQADVQQDHDNALGHAGHGQHRRRQLGQGFSQYDHIPIIAAPRFL